MRDLIQVPTLQRCSLSSVAPYLRAVQDHLAGWFWLSLYCGRHSEDAAQQFIMMLQEACSGPLRDAARTQGAAFAELRVEDLRPVVLKDFKVQWPGCSRAVGTVLPECRRSSLTKGSPTAQVAARRGQWRRGAADLTCCRSPCSGHLLWPASRSLTTRHRATDGDQGGQGQGGAAGGCAV